MTDHDAGPRGTEDTNTAPRDPADSPTREIPAVDTTGATSSGPGAVPSSGAFASHGTESVVPDPARAGAFGTTDFSVPASAGAVPSGAASAGPGPARTAPATASGTASASPGAGAFASPAPPRYRFRGQTAAKKPPAGYAFGPGGAGWDAPGWRTVSASEPAPRRRFGLVALLAAGLVGVVVGALLVVMVDRPWRDDRPEFGVVVDQPGPRQNVPRFCERTDTGFRCEFPRS
ncbi:hypothetical protein [Herbidospora daliensis]|uniref:hypothetical protein n=1 Tax=Herbidospora daliensis TaxID=295585 RepID=UPI000784F36C|nr:hypothetical protein [Herbidospora daliensis]